MRWALLYWCPSYSTLPWKAPAILLLFTLTSVSSMLQAQSDCIKQISYQLLEQRYHALEAHVDVESLPPLDLLRGKDEVQLLNVTICIDQQGYVTRTTNITYQENTYYPNPVTRIVHTPHEVISFDQDGNEINRMDASIPEEPIPGLQIPLSTEMIQHYGTQVDLTAMAASLQSEFSDPEDQFWVEGSKHYFTSPDQELIIAEADLYTIMNNYGEDDELDMSIVHVYQQRGAHQIPEYQIQQEYQPMHSGDWLQSTTFRTYLNYTVEENGQTIIQHVRPDQQVLQELTKKRDQQTTGFGAFKRTERLAPSVQLFPNPAQTEVQVQYKGRWSAKEIRAELLNSQHQLVRGYVKPAEDTQLSLDLSDLAPGLYFIRSRQKGLHLIQKLIITK